MRHNLIGYSVAVLVTFLAVFIVHAVESRNVSPAAVLSVREFELRSGVKPEEFEKYAREELTRALSQAKTGAHFRILKGDRGDRKGGYLLIWEFESVAARNEFFPKEGGGASPASQQAWKR